MRDWKEEIAEGEAAELEGLAARLRAMQMDRYEAFGPTRSRSSLWRTRPRREYADATNRALAHAYTRSGIAP